MFQHHTLIHTPLYPIHRPPSISSLHYQPFRSSVPLFPLSTNPFPLPCPLTLSFPCPSTLLLSPCPITSLRCLFTNPLPLSPNPYPFSCPLITQPAHLSPAHHYSSLLSFPSNTLPISRQRPLPPQASRILQRPLHLSVSNILPSFPLSTNASPPLLLPVHLAPLTAYGDTGRKSRGRVARPASRGGSRRS